MKSVILASVIFILIIIFVISGYVYTDRIAKDMLDSLEKNEIFVAKKDWKSAKNEIDNFSEIWSESRKFLAFFVNHTVIDDIDCNISRIKTAIKMKEKGTFLKEKEIIKIKIDAMNNLQRISLENLF